MDIILLEIAKLIALGSGFGFGVFFFYMNIKGNYYNYPKWSYEEIAESIFKDTTLSFLPFIIILVLTK